MVNRTTLLFIFSVCLIGLIGAPPVDPKKKDPETGEHAPRDPEDLGLEYGRYLQQVIQVLEEDKEFAKKLENVSAESIKSGAVAKELEFVQHNVRSKLDELKRIEMERLRELVRMKQSEDLGGMENSRLIPPANDGRQWRTLSLGDALEKKKFRRPHHVDIKNPHTFEIEDLKQLIMAASKDLEDLNEKRKEEFKQYELEKEHKYREELKKMNEADRKVAEAKHKEMMEKHKDHPQVHHPGSKQQLEQVWEEVDHLPKEEFDPKTFFRMHDLNEDNHLDEEEVRILVALEIRKMYNLSNEEDDPVEREEELRRMQEHIFKEADKNHDRLISLDEFLDMTKTPDFEQDPGWKGLDEEQMFTPEELMEYERQLAAQGYHPNMPYGGGYPQGGYPQGGYPQGGYPQGGYQADQQYGYQPVQGVPPSNQGVQFQPLPNQGQQPHQGQGSQQQNSIQNQGMGQPPHSGQPVGQPPHPGQPMGQPHPGQPMGQPPHPGQPHPGQPMGQGHYGGPQGQPPIGGAPPHYPPQYGPAGGGPPPQYGGHPNQGAPQPNQGVPPQPQAVPHQGNAQPPIQPQAPAGGNAQQQQQGGQGTGPR